MQPVSAQNTISMEKRLEFKETNQPESDDFQLVHQLIAQGAYISAANMLEGLYEIQPDDRNVINLLLICYTELKAYPKAEMLLQRQLEKNENDYLFQLKLLELYQKTGADSSVTVQINKILDRFPGDRDIYLAVVQVLIRDGYAEQATELILRAREEFNEKNLFTLHLATLYETKQMYYKAVMEYFNATQSDSASAHEAEKKTASLIRYPLAPNEAARAFRDILDTHPNNVYALKYLSETYIRQEKFTEAFETVIRIDSVLNKEGRELLGYLRKCRDRKLYDQVLQTSEYFERMYPESHTLMNYRSYRAEALRGLGQPYDAIEIYKIIIDSSVNRRDKFNSLCEIGNIYRYDLINYDSARIMYDSVTVNCPYGRILFMTNLEKAQLFLVEGDLEQAKLSFTGLIKDGLPVEHIEYLEYNLAMIDFLGKEFETAEKNFRQLLQKYPRGFYLNDALINSLIIGESFLDVPEILSEYAEGLLFQYRLKPDSMENRFRSIIDKGQSPLVGITCYKLADYYYQNNDENKALEIIDKIENEFSDDYFYPYCLKIKGDIYSQDINNEENKNKASEIYRLILTDFNNYPFLGEIRIKLQELEGYISNGKI
ncbi:MAG: tetratricopeptide repeat protein [candidate division Zixibacteria bacterium]|nr:tetratricopeptide repeat protein [candidate division Zixibacteria bacterium]